MGRCDVCGIDYEKTMVITTPDRRGTFDSFECAVHAMAPAHDADVRPRYEKWRVTRSK